NPATGETIAELPRMGVAETRRAIERAEAALPTWRSLVAKDRARILRRWADLMLDHQEDLARLLTTEQGKPLAEARVEVEYAASFYEWFGEQAKRIDGDTIPTHAADKRIVVTKHPIGVTAGITPWNFPAAMPTRKSAPALAAGCTMVLKPAEQTPLSALAVARLGLEAGLPEGVLEIVTGAAEDAPVIGGELTGNPTARQLGFPGSTPGGKLLLEQVERHVGDALERGGELLLGGEGLGGLFWQPTVIAGVTAGAAMSCEETFGPVAGVARFASEADAIRQANDTPYGLAAYFYTRDMG